MHLRIIFDTNLDYLSAEMKKIYGEKFKEWSEFERREIIRELHKIRSTNKLLSEHNVEFRQKFHKLMKTFNNPDLRMGKEEVELITLKLESFVRGFHSLDTSKHRPADAEPKEEEKEGVKGVIETTEEKTSIYYGEEDAKATPSPSQDPPHLKVIEKEKEKEKEKQEDEVEVVDWTRDEEHRLCNLFLELKGDISHIYKELVKGWEREERWSSEKVVESYVSHLLKKGLLKMIAFHNAR